MFKEKFTVLGLSLLLILVSFTPAVATAETELWELLIDLNIEDKVINSGESVVIAGKVVDQAYEPIRGVEVVIRTGSVTMKVFTDPDGDFRGEFTNFQKIPGTYSVNVIATWYDMTGVTSGQFEVKGEISKIIILEEKLSTIQAIKYLSANRSDFERNPIGQILFKYYHTLLEELILEKKAEAIALDRQNELEEQRRIAEEQRNQDVEEYNWHTGVYDGYKYQDYINSLNPKIKDMMINQLNFTKNLFEEAQKIREQILADGGTPEEARKAYLDAVSIPKEVLEQFDYKEDDETVDEVTDEGTDETVDEVTDEGTDETVDEVTDEN